MCRYKHVVAKTTETESKYLTYLKMKKKCDPKIECQVRHVYNKWVTQHLKSPVRDDM